MVAQAQSTASSALFELAQPAPPDPILGLTEAFLADTRSEKVNLGVGVYQNGSGKVPLLKAVHEAESRLLAGAESKSYLPIDGYPVYNKLVQQLLLGADAPLTAEGRAITIQALGGTGALKIGADFLRNVCGAADIWISSPSWENHRAVFENAGLQVNQYPYYNPETHLADFDAMISALEALPHNSVILLHACCHNPTGADLTPPHWDRLVTLCSANGLLPFLDFAYQGFGTGIQEDAYAVRAFAAAGIRCHIANSFSKSFSLYRERVGALTVITGSAAESKTLLSQIKRVVRTNYSSPAAHGAQIVAAILGDAELRSLWENELTEMRQRIHLMRSQLCSALKVTGSDFSFIVNQNGMFSYSGLSTEVVRKVRSDYGIYIVDSGPDMCCGPQWQQCGLRCRCHCSVSLDRALMVSRRSMKAEYLSVPETEDGSELNELQSRLGVSFKDTSLLVRALTHRSAAVDCSHQSNERLEFLGDSIVGLVVCEHLYRQFPRPQRRRTGKVKGLYCKRELSCRSRTGDWAARVRADERGRVLFRRAKAKVYSFGYVRSVGWRNLSRQRNRYRTARRPQGPEEHHSPGGSGSPPGRLQVVAPGTHAGAIPIGADVSRGG